MGRLIFTSRPEDEIVNDSGPRHVPRTWCNSEDDHKTAVIASLVQATYILEKDRRRRLFMSGSTTTRLAPPWFENFGFKLHSTLDDTRSKIFGAVYEYECPQHRNGIPLYVIAFRGTSTKKDLQLDARIIINRLHHSSRSSEIAVKKVKEILIHTKMSTVWLAGHSLGASMAMLVSKRIALEDGVFLELFLFNPPFPSLPTEQIKSTKIKDMFRTGKNLLTASLATVANLMRHENQTNESTFAALKDWVPYLFVNEYDIVCAEYIGYFKHREYMEKKGLGGIGRVATQYSTVGALLSFINIGKEYEESLHRIPSANLTVNLKPSQGLLEDHALSQWWRSDLKFNSTVYK